MLLKANLGIPHYALKDVKIGNFIIKSIKSTLDFMKLYIQLIKYMIKYVYFLTGMEFFIDYTNISQDWT